MDWCAAGGTTPLAGPRPLSRGGGGGLCSVLPNILVRDLSCFASLVLLWLVLLAATEAVDRVRLLFRRVSSDSGSSIWVLFKSIFETGVMVNSDFFLTVLLLEEEEFEMEMEVSVVVVLFVVDREGTGGNDFGPTFAFLAPI